MTNEEKILVQKSFEKVIPISDEVALQFYERLFELEPKLKPLFKTDINAQGAKLMELLSYAISSLDNLEELVPAVKDLGGRHVQYGVKDEHYELVGQALIWVLEKNLAEEFTKDMRSAWVSVYTLLSDVMIKASH